MQVEGCLFHYRRSAVLIVASGLIFAALAGCHRAPSPDVMATVNGKDIMRSELDKYYKERVGDNPQQASQEQAQIVRLDILRQLIQDEILQQRAAKLNLAATDEDVNAKLTEMKAPYTEEQFQRLLKQRGMTLDDLKRDLRRSLTSTRLLNKEIESKINITDAEIKAYYDAHKSDFNQIEPQYHLAWIVVTDTPSQQAGNLQSNKASSTVDAKKKIETLQNRLESGEEFSTVAMNFSEDPNTSPMGGDMGFIAESALQNDPEVFNAIGKLKPGEITGILPTYSGNGTERKPIGFAIFKLLGKEPAGQRELNDPNVQQSIHQLLHQSRFQLLQSAYFETLHDQATVHNYYAEQILNNQAN
ncbi:MAG TPA: SurA N-terminal domain-containing protein [Terracidiphilus sp.]|nr:SurA N-terminal domain-containing protein [Terracidiphilus sp.]